MDKLQIVISIMSGLLIGVLVTVFSGYTVMDSEWWVIIIILNVISGLVIGAKE